jgi:hypothetical protein
MFLPRVIRPQKVRDDDASNCHPCASEPMTEPTDPELRRWHGRVVVGILVAGSAAFAFVFWVAV